MTFYDALKWCVNRSPHKIALMVSSLVKRRRDLCCLASERQLTNHEILIFNAVSSYFNALYYLFHMALDRLSCCKCLLVYVTFYHSHWSVDCLELL